MALSWSEQILPAGSQYVNVEMSYLDRSYIHVYLNDVEVNDFTWVSDTRIRLDAQLTEATTVAVVRRTDRSFLYILFAEGAAFIKENLDTQNTQFLHLAQELVEGRSIEGFYGDISMNGYKITNLGRGTEPGDAVNKEQLDEVDTRVTNLEHTFIGPTSSYPWFTNTTEETDVLTPGFTFTKAAVYINGVCQTPGYSYEVVDNTIMLADPVPAGTHIMARLGEDVPNEQGYATAAQLSNTNGRVDTVEQSYAKRGVNADIKALTGLTTAITLAQGGTGATTAAGARTSLAAAKSGDNSDITSMANKVAFTQSAVLGDYGDTSTGIQIGGAVPNNGTDGIRMFTDGSSGWLGVRASKWPHPTEMAIYPSSKSGSCQTVSGSNAVKILSGASITSEAIGKTIAIYDALYTVASVTADGFTVTNTNGSPVAWGSNATHTYSLCYYHGNGLCSVSGTTVTRISGDPFVIPDAATPQTMTINGIDYRVLTFTDPQHVTLDSAPGDSPSTEYEFWGTVNSLNTALRVHRINDAGFEENISLIANNSGYYALHAAASNQANEQYPLYIGSGWEDNGKMRRSIISAANGDVTLGGNYGNGPLYVPYSQNSNPQVMLDNRSGTATVTVSGGPTQDASLTLKAKGAGGVVFHSEVKVDAALYPFVDNIYSCGTSGNRWSQIWASNATIQTSDGTTKTEVQGSNLSTDFILGLNPVSYKNIVGGNVVEEIEDGVEEIERQVVEKVVTSEEVHERVVDGDEVYYVRKFVDKEVERPVYHEVDLRDELGNVIGTIKTPLMEKATVPKTRQVITEVPGKRTHYGFIAQEVKGLVDKLGISDFGGYVEGEDGRLGLRYGEFISPIVSCLQDIIKRLELLEKE